MFVRGSPLTFIYLIFIWDRLYRMSQVIQAPSLQETVVSGSTSEEIVKEIDLSRISLSAPVYKYRRLMQVSGGANLSPTASTTQSQFVIPGSSVWNFHKSFLTYDVVISESAVANSLTNAFTDTHPIDSIRLQTDSGAILVDLQNVQAFLKAAQHLAIDLDEFQSRSPIYGNVSSVGLKPKNVCFGCNPSSFDGSARTSLQISAQIPSALSVIDTSAPANLNAALDAATASARPALAASGADDQGRGAPQRVVSGAAVRDGAGAGNLFVRCRLNMKAFVGTILAMNKDLYFGQNLQLQIMWKGLQNWGFNDVVACNTHEAAVTIAANAVSNYYLYMAEDINEELTMPMKAQIRSQGANILVPYTVCSSYSTTNAATLQTSTIPLTPGTGLKLKRIFIVPVNSNDQLKLTANTFNVAGVKYSTVQSFIDGRPLQDMPLTWSNGDVYNYLYEMCKNSPAFLSQRIFEENAFYFDNFSDCYDSTHWYDNDCKLSGLDVTMAKSYAFQLTQECSAGNALRLNQYQVWVRPLAIKPDGIKWA